MVDRIFFTSFFFKCGILFIFGGITILDLKLYLYLDVEFTYLQRLVDFTKLYLDVKKLNFCTLEVIFSIIVFCFMSLKFYFLQKSYGLCVKVLSFSSHFCEVL
jgi:hypothetical protein